MNKKIVGIFLVLVTNICYIGNNYLVKWAELGPGEVSLIRGLIQILVFSTIIYVQRRRSSKDETSPSLKQWILICVYGFFSSTMAYACIMAVSLMPISDLIVICYLCPVFSVILDALVLKRPLTVLSVLLCIIIVIGDVLVVQPSFIFSEKSVPTNLQNSSNEIELELEHEYNSNQTSSVLKDMIGADSDTNYMIGVCLCIYSALAASIDNVVQVLVSRNDEKKIVSRSHWVTSTGIFSTISKVNLRYLLSRCLGCDSLNNISTTTSQSSVDLTPVHVTGNCINVVCLRIYHHPGNLVVGHCRQPDTAPHPGHHAPDD